MNEDTEKKLAEKVLTAATSNIPKKMVENEQIEVNQAISEIIGEAVEIQNPELKTLHEFKDRLSRIEKRISNLENELENKDVEMWIFKVRLENLVSDLYGDRFNQSNIELQLEEIEEWLQMEISQQVDTVSPEDGTSIKNKEEIESEPPDDFELSTKLLDQTEGIDNDNPPVPGWPESVEDSLTEFEERLAEFESRFSSPTGWVEEFHDQFDDLSQEIDNSEGYFNGLRQDVDDFVHCLNNPATVSDEFKYGSTIEHFIDRLEQELEDLDTKHAELSQEMGQYRDQYVIFEETLNEHQEELESIHTRIVDNEEKLETISADLDSAEQIVDGYGSTLSVFNVRVQELAEKIDSLEERIDSKDVILGISASEIENLENRRKELLHVAVEDQNLEDTIGRLKNLEQRIQTLHEKYDELEEPTPEQAAKQSNSQACYCIAGDKSTAYTIKPTNIELDIKTALEVVGGGTAVAGATGGLSQAGIVLLLCAALYDDIKTEVKIEDAFVYWVGYKNRGSLWELPKNELPELVEEEQSEVDIDISMEDDEVFDAVTRLERKGSLDEIEKDDETYIVFRETCRVEWE